MLLLVLYLLLGDLVEILEQYKNTVLDLLGGRARGSGVETKELGVVAGNGRNTGCGDGTECWGGDAEGAEGEHVFLCVCASAVKVGMCCPPGPLADVITRFFSCEKSEKLTFQPRNVFKNASLAAAEQESRRLQGCNALIVWGTPEMLSIDTRATSTSRHGAMSARLSLFPDTAAAGAPSKAVVAPGANNSEYGVHDTLREGFYSVLASSQPVHPVEAINASWDDNQRRLRLEMQRRVQGLAAPFREHVQSSIMDKNEKNFKNPALLGGSRGTNLAREILNDRNASIGWEDVLGHHGDVEDYIDPIVALEHARGLGKV